MSETATGSEWVAVRSLDGRRFVLKVLSATDPTQAKALAARQMSRYDRIENEHLVHQHDAIALADGTLALVLDEVSGGALAQLLGARGQLTVGETVTTVAPLFRALGDLHDAGVVHGDLVPGNIVFSTDGRPLIGDLGVAALLGRHAGSLDGACEFFAPELVDGLVGGAAPSPASDVYAMAALGWFCLTGAPPGPAATGASLTTIRPETPPQLVEVLIACLATDPAARPAAGDAAAVVFDAAPAESVALASVSDPAAEITRRIRAGATVLPAALPAVRQANRAWLVFGLVALLAATALGVGAAWFLPRPPEALQPVVVRSSAPQPVRHSATQLRASTAVVPAKTSQSPTGAVTSSSSPRRATTELLQALVDARALAYVARESNLLDLVYAPGARRAAVDKGNIAAALKSGGTYLGLSFAVKDVAFLGGTTDTARIRATILTPAYQTGQPDGRKIRHAQEILAPCIFTLGRTPDGWRILDLTVP